MHESLQPPYNKAGHIKPAETELGWAYHQRFMYLAQAIEEKVANQLAAGAETCREKELIKIGYRSGEDVLEFALNRLYDDAGESESFVIRVTQGGQADTLVLIHDLMLLGAELKNPDDSINTAQLDVIQNLLENMYNTSVFGKN